MPRARSLPEALGQQADQVLDRGLGIERRVDALRTLYVVHVQHHVPARHLAERGRMSISRM